jgi:hypothetical protein
MDPNALSAEWQACRDSLADRDLPGGVPRLAMTTKQQTECLEAAQRNNRPARWLAGWLDKARREGRVPGAYARDMILANADLTVVTPGSEAERVRNAEEQEETPRSQEELRAGVWRGWLKLIRVHGEEKARDMLLGRVGEETFAALVAEVNAGRQRALTAATDAPPADPEPAADPLEEMLRTFGREVPGSTRPRGPREQEQVNQARAELARHAARRRP